MRGAGPSGGLLFLAVLGVVAWLVVRDLQGWPRALLLVLVCAAVVGLGVNVSRRR